VRKKTSVSMSFYYFYILVEIITSSLCSQDCTHVGCSQATGEVAGKSTTTCYDLRSNRGFIPFMKLLCDKNTKEKVTPLRRRLCVCTRKLIYTANNSMVETAWPSGGALDL